MQSDPTIIYGISKGYPLEMQSDPTIIYGISKGYPLGRGIRESEITGQTPYNTYVIDALPPGPICNPGKDSIAAVLNPEQTGDYYFVASGKGGHVFSASIAEHQRNVIAYRARERMKEGSDIVLPEPSVTPPALPVVKPAVPAVKPATRRKRRG
jgi:cell division protein YceG involved in septum cleavage